MLFESQVQENYRGYCKYQGAKSLTIFVPITSKNTPPGRMNPSTITQYRWRTTPSLSFAKKHNLMPKENIGEKCAEQYTCRVKIIEEGRSQSIHRHTLNIYSRWDQRHFLQFNIQRVYRLEIANFLRTISHVGIFDLAFWSVLYPCCPSSLLSGSPLPLPTFPVWISTVYVCIQCVRRGGGCRLCWRPDQCTWPDSEPTKLIDPPKTT